MANKIKNKFTSPKATEFTPKDLVVDIKNGHLYYKSNIGVHKLVGDTIGTSIIEGGSGLWIDNGTFIFYDGNVSASGNLTIEGNVNASGTLSGNNLNIISPNAQLGLIKSSTNDQQAYLKIDSANDGTATHSYVYFNEGGSGRGAVGYRANTDTIALVYANGIASTNGIHIDSNGRVGIGDASPVYKLEIVEDRKQQYMAKFTNQGQDEWGYGIIINIEMDGEGFEDTTSFIRFERDGIGVGSITHEVGVATHYNTSSDKRLKTNIIPTKYSLDDLLKIEIVDYEFKDSPGKQTTGIIAQQAKEIYPDFIHAPENKNLKEGDEGYEYMQADYGKLTPLLAKSIQDLYNIIQEQEKRIKQLENGN